MTFETVLIVYALVGLIGAVIVGFIRMSDHWGDMQEAFVLSVLVLSLWPLFIIAVFSSVFDKWRR